MNKIRSETDLFHRTLGRYVVPDTGQKFNHFNSDWIDRGAFGKSKPIRRTFKSPIRFRYRNGAAISFGQASEHGCYSGIGSGKKERPGFGKDTVEALAATGR